MKRGGLVLMVALCALLLCACQQAAAPAEPQGNASGYPIAPEKLTLTAMQFELDNQAIDFGNLWFYQQLEEKTNIHIEFDEVKQADWGTKLNLMFASGDYRDMVLRGSLDLEEYGVGQQLLLPLDDVMARNMPIYTQRVADANLAADLRSSDGHTYSIGFLISQGVNTNGHFFINQNWLSRLGLSMPATVDELTDVLRAFRDGDTNGNGLSDEVPYQATFGDNNNGVYNAFAFFGVPMNEYYICVGDDGHVYFPVMRDGFRQCVEWLHLLCEEKLLDMECITQGSNLWGAKVNQNTAGLFTYWRLGNSTLKSEIAEQFTCMLPVAAEGRTPCVSRIMDTIDFGASLTVANEHVDESLRWLDAQFDTETMMVSQNGPVGDMLFVGEDGKYQVAYIPQENELYSIVPVICGQSFAPSNYYRQVYVPAAHRLEKIRYSEQYEQADVMEKVSFQVLTSVAHKTEGQSKRITDLFNTLKNQINASLVEFLTQGVTDENWQAFLTELDNIGWREYVSLYQQVYDTYRRGVAAS